MDQEKHEIRVEDYRRLLDRAVDRPYRRALKKIDMGVSNLMCWPGSHMPVLHGDILAVFCVTELYGYCAELFLH